MANLRDVDPVLDLNPRSIFGDGSRIRTLEGVAGGFTVPSASRKNYLLPQIPSSSHRSRLKRSAGILTPMSPHLSFLHANSDAIKAIAARHKAFNVAVFGSVARGDDRPGSDIDFLVTFTPDASLTDLAGLHDSLEEFLEMPVDVISLGGLKPRDSHIRQESLAL